jgi:hypothetical protein
LCPSLYIISRQSFRYEGGFDSLFGRAASERLGVSAFGDSSVSRKISSSSSSVATGYLAKASFLQDILLGMFVWFF